MNSEPILGLQSVHNSVRGVVIVDDIWIFKIVVWVCQNLWALGLAATNNGVWE